ncbi:MAG: hypothetical protein ACK6DZ_18785, partial [Acidobacteriota bacterium]
FSECGTFEGEVLRMLGDGSLETMPQLLAPEWDDAANRFNQHRRFVESVLAGEAPEVSGEEGLEDVRVVEECYAQVEGARE